MKTLSIDSRDRVSTSSSSTEFKIQVLDNLVWENVKKISLSQATIPNNFFVINSSNNTLSWEESAGGGAISSTLTVGNYSPTTFASHLKTVLDADTNNAQTYTVSWSTVTNFFTITTSANFIVNFASMSSLAKIMGFPASNTTAATSITSSYCSNFDTSQRCFIEIKEIPSRIKLGGSRYSHPTFSIQNTANFGEILYYSPVNEKENSLSYESELNLNATWTVRLLDQDYNLVSLNTFTIGILKL